MALNSKRMLTFFNEFLITTTGFLNSFATECEDKFFELERKLNKIESNLLIIEHKLASIPTEEKAKPIPEATDVVKQQPLTDVETLTQPKETSESINQEELKLLSQPTEDVPESTSNVGNKIKISESALYRKYFKMLKFGIALPAVKQKMESEGFDSNLLDNPDFFVEKTPEDYEEQ